MSTEIEQRLADRRVELDLTNRLTGKLLVNALARSGARARWQ